jgi:hypothetical protein
MTSIHIYAADSSFISEDTDIQSNRMNKDNDNYSQ